MTLTNMTGHKRPLESSTPEDEHNGPHNDIVACAAIEQPVFDASTSAEADQPIHDLSQEPASDSDSDSDSDNDSGEESEESIVAKNVPSALKNEERDDIRFPYIANPRNAMFPCPTDKQLKWMDACSKCLCVEKSPPAAMKASEGYTFAFPFPSIGTAIPTEALEVVNLFLRILKAFETDMGGFVVPTPYLGLLYNIPPSGRSKSAPRCIGITQKLKSVFTENRPPNAPFEIRDIFEQCAAENCETSQDVLVAPISIHIGFTGCTFKEGEGGACDETKRTFCIVFINCPCNVDIVGFMQDVFFVLPNISNSFNQQSKYQETQQDIESFLQILRFQCDLFKMSGAFTDPKQWLRNPFGTFGLVSVCNIFTIPLKILATIHAEHKGAKDVKIVGFPELSFDANDMIRHFTSYMRLFVKTVCFCLMCKEICFCLLSNLIFHISCIFSH